jgi:phosphoribosylformimino-5-aminoimidazole carboxamide ribonucleotide (ProFAR) isomerase
MDVNGEEGEGRVRVCPYCFSHEIDEVALIGGPMAQLDNDNGTFKCHKCGRVAVPMEFNSWEEYVAFVWERDDISIDNFRVLPMMPMIWDDETGEPFVIDISWDDRLVVGSKRASFKEYWKVSSKEVYNSISSFVVDIDGTLTGNTRVTEIQRILRKKADISLDVGIRSDQDVYDCFTMGAWEVIACSWAIPSIDIFGKIIEMTDRCVPCLCHESSLVWSKNKGNPDNLEDAVRRLKDMGYDTIAIMDLWSLGKGEFHGKDLIARAKGLDVNIIAGGGIDLAQAKAVKELGADGAMLDPFAPELELAFNKNDVKDLPPLS